MGNRLAGKAVVVTGSGAGIGKTSAKLFAEEGARVVIADIDGAAGKKAVEEILAQKGEALFVPTDVADPLQVAALMKAAEQRFGRIDVLFNNAAVNHVGKVTETSVEDWDRVMAVNVRSVFLGCRYAIPIMQEHGGGAIINTASAAAIVGLRGLAVYTASKGAVLQLTKNLALDYAADNIRVNALCPGVTATEMTLGVIARSPDPEAARARMDSGRPMGRMGQPMEIAQAALFLASDESSYMTGAHMLVDGGYCAG